MTSRDVKLKWDRLLISAFDNTIYGASGRGDLKGWVGLDTATGGATALSDRHVGSLIYAGKRFYCLTERGTMTLQKLDKEGFIGTGSFELAKGKDVRTPHTLRP